MREDGARPYRFQRTFLDVGQEPDRILHKMDSCQHLQLAGGWKVVRIYTRGSAIEFACFVVAADTLEIDGEVFQRGQLIFDEKPGAAFSVAKQNGDILPVDPFGDLNVQLTLPRKQPLPRA